MAAGRRDDEQPGRSPPANAIEADDDDALTMATVASRPSALRQPPPARPGSSSAGGTQLPGRGSSLITSASLGASSSPMDALALEEVERSRGFARVSVLLCAALLAGLPFAGGDPTVRWILIGAVAICLLTAIWFQWRMRDPANFNTRVATVLAMWAAITSYVGVYFWGIFSAAPALLVVGIYFFSRSQSFGATVLVYGFCAAAQAVLAALVLGGVMEDRGMFPRADQPFHVLLIAQLIIQGIYLFVFLLARSTRESSLKSIEMLQRAMRRAAQNEAQFEEVKADLDRALEAGGLGRYTEQVLGSYRLGAVIGRGAMGEVYEAAQVDSGELAAVKVLHPNVLENPDSVARFMREAQASSALASPHTVRVIDASDPTASVPYLVMERLHGHDLGHHLRKRRRLSPGELEQLVREVGSVIDLEREIGIVHRDLKPQNLFLANTGDEPPVWKILDFGVSKLAEHSGTLTQGRVVGTPSYMAPEQAVGGEVDSRADLYALGAIAYRCLTGRAPFVGKEVAVVLHKVIYTMPPRPSSLASLPPALDDVLAIALAKRPDDRFASAAELADALATAASGGNDDWLERRAQALLASLPWGGVRAP